MNSQNTNNNKKNKNLPSLTTNTNSPTTKKNQKKSSINIRNNNNLKTNVKKDITHSNSQVTLNNRQLTAKKENSNFTTTNSNNVNTNVHNSNSIIMNSSLLEVENIDISSYNSDPYVIPKKKFEHLYVSKIEKTVNNYNLIKEVVNTKIEEIQLPSNIPLIQVKNFSLLDLLDKLNTILDSLIERKHFTKKKDVIDASEKSNSNSKSKNRVSRSQEILKLKLSTKEINKKSLESYKKQHELLTAKYEKYSNVNYIQNVKEEIKKISDEISKLEKENRDLQTNQYKVEYLLKTKNNSSLNEINYKKNVDKFNHFNNEYTMIMKKIPPKDIVVKNNDLKIEQLNERKEELIKIAKETYNIENPEEKKVFKLMIDKDRTKNEIRRRELEKIILEKESNVKKYNILKKDNVRYIKQLEEDKKILEDILVSKYEEIFKLNNQLKKLESDNGLNITNNEVKENQIGYKKINNNNSKNNSISKKDENTTKNTINNNISSIDNQISPIKSADNNINQTKIEDLINKISYNNDNNAIINNLDSNTKAIDLDLNKKNGIRNLDNNKNNISSNLTNNNRYNGSDNNINDLIDNNKTYNKKMILEQLDIQKNKENTIKIDSTTNLKKNKLKPNFSFTLNDTNKKDKNVNLSVAIMPKTTINKEEQNESEGEIKEDIQINTNLNDEKINTNIDNKIEEQKMDVNLSQNISVEIEKNDNDNDNNDEGKIRENDFNTLPYDKFANEEQKNNNTNIDNNNNGTNIDNYNDNIKINEKLENENDLENELN